MSLVCNRTAFVDDMDGDGEIEMEWTIWKRLWDSETIRILESLKREGTDRTRDEKIERLFKKYNVDWRMDYDKATTET